MAQDLCARLREKKLISIVRGAPTEKITKIADAIYRGGFRFMEITFDQSGKTPHAVTAEQIRIVREAFDGRLHVGAGTVMTEAQLKLAAEAGAEYIISPNVDTAIIRATKAAGLISIPGAFTPSEIAGAYQAGADFVKLFPADCVDLKYIKAVRAPINHIPLLAVSGVTPENLGDYLNAGMAGAGIGSILVTKADVANEDYDAIAQRAARYVAESPESGAAAIASPECASLYGLNVIRKNIADSDSNYTRFICVSKEPEILPGANRISIMFTLPHRPGSLAHVLSLFADAGINLLKIESEPIPGKEFEFRFYIDLDAAGAEESAGEILARLARECPSYRFLGQYTEEV